MNALEDLLTSRRHEVLARWSQSLGPSPETNPVAERAVLDGFLRALGVAEWDERALERFCDDGTCSPARLERALQKLTDSVLCVAEDAGRPLSHADVRALLGLQARLSSKVLALRDAHHAALERQHREQEERFDLMMRVGSMGFWVWDLATDRVTWGANTERLFGLPDPSMVPGTYDEYISVLPLDEQESVRRKVDNCVRNGEPYTLEHSCTWMDGTEHFLLARGHAQRENGVTKRILGVVMDITEQRNAENERLRLLHEAEDANRLKDEFLATVSHELRTPLTSMLGWAQILRSGVSSPERLRKGLETIERNARAQTQLIEDLLDVSRIITGKMRLESAVVELRPFLEAAVESIRPAAEAKDLVVLQEISQESCRVLGDPTRLQQIVWNLLSNAVKFTPRGGTVAIQLRRGDKGFVRVRVRDTGEGIDPEFVPFVFERFRQADSRTTRRHSGLGLGLAITRHLVEMHGGIVRVEESVLGKGTVFALDFPLSALPLDRRVARAVEKTDEKRLEGVKVLVVEDEKDARELIVTTLERLQMKVAAAASAQEAFAAVTASPPDVIVSDIGMPGEDGYALIRRIRALPPSNGGMTPAVALTAFARREDRRDALEAGFQGFVTKPLSSNDLVTTLVKLLPASA